VIETPLIVNVPGVSVVRSPAVAKSASGSIRPKPTLEVTVSLLLLKSLGLLQEVTGIR